MNRSHKISKEDILCHFSGDSESLLDQVLDLKWVESLGYLAPQTPIDQPVSERGTAAALKASEGRVSEPSGGVVKDDPVSTPQGSPLSPPPIDTVSNDSPSGEVVLPTLARSTISISDSRADPFAIPVPEALPQRAEFERGLRSFRVRKPSNTEREFDVKSTIESLCDLSTVISVFKPKQELVFNAEILIDNCRAMDIWQEPLDDLLALIRRSKVFQVTNFCYLRDLQISTSRERAIPGGIGVQPRGAVGARGKNLLLIISDFADAAWQDRRDLIRGLADKYLVILVSVLQTRLWQNTRISWADWVRAQPGELNNYSLGPLDPDDDLDPGDLWLPILELTPHSLSSLSNLVLSRPKHAITATSLFRLTKGGGQKRVEEASLSREDILEKLQAFRQVADPEAFELLRRMVAIPLIFPLIRMIQARFTPKGRLEHIAHVLGTGLIQRAADIPRGYDFAPLVRETLLDIMPAHHVQETIQAVSDYIEDHCDVPGGLDAYLHNPEGRSALPAQAQVIANLSEKVLARVGIKPQQSRMATRISTPKGWTVDLAIWGPYGTRIYMLGRQGIACFRTDGTLVWQESWEADLEINHAFFRDETLCISVGNRSLEADMPGLRRVSIEWVLENVDSYKRSIVLDASLVGHRNGPEGDWIVEKVLSSTPYEPEENGHAARLPGRTHWTFPVKELFSLARVPGDLIEVGIPGTWQTYTKKGDLVGKAGGAYGCVPYRHPKLALRFWHDINGRRPSWTEHIESSSFMGVQLPYGNISRLPWHPELPILLSTDDEGARLHSFGAFLETKSREADGRQLPNLVEAWAKTPVPNPVSGMCFSQDGRDVWLATEDGVYETGETGYLTLITNIAGATAITTGQRRMVVGTRSSDLLGFVDPRMPKTVWASDAPVPGQVTSVSCLGPMLVCTTESHGSHVFFHNTRNTYFSTHLRDVHGVSSNVFSTGSALIGTAKGDLFWVQNDDGQVSSHLVRNLQCGSINEIAFMRERAIVAFATTRFELLITDLDFIPIISIRQHSPVVSTSFSADGAKLACLLLDGTVRIYETATWGELSSLKIEAGSYMGSIQFHPTKSHILAAFAGDTKTVHRLTLTQDERAVRVWCSFPPESKHDSLHEYVYHSVARDPGLHVTWGMDVRREGRDIGTETPETFDFELLWPSSEFSRRTSARPIEVRPLRSKPNPKSLIHSVEILPESTSALSDLLRFLRDGRRRLAGKRVFVVTSLAPSTAEENLYTLLGEALSRLGCHLVTGGFSGGDEVIADAFADPSRITHYRVHGKSPKIWSTKGTGFGSLVSTRSTEQSWRDAISSSDYVLVIGGSKGARSAVRWALALGKSFVISPQEGAFRSDLWKVVNQAWSKKLVSLRIPLTSTSSPTVRQVASSSWNVQSFINLSSKFRFFEVQVESLIDLIADDSWQKESWFQEIEWPTNLFDSSFVSLSEQCGMSPLELLRARKLSVSASRVEMSIDPIALLPNLEELDLTEVSMFDFRPLRSCTTLRSLIISRTRLADVKFLTEMVSLESLDVSETKVSDLSPVALLPNLRKLAIRETKVSDLSPVAELTNLEELDLSRTNVSDLSPVALLPNLKKLAICETKVSDLSPVFELTNLIGLDVRGCEIPAETISFLREGMPWCSIKA